ncbi:DUF1493 family protein [uncultured Sulfitobacter sp.]|uniref:DUF1493 family protein n=1 Tax=uncultured Sulfitobacter sp. TaxID=191468 RepID=UPI002618B6C0|nr:DUF1493 family protein [uncultured Sulfitobacter sp.]
MSHRDEIIQMLSEEIGQHFIVEPDEDLFGKLYLSGDDVNEFLEAYALRFNVDMSAFLWYFHYNADEPPQGRRVLPVLSDGRVADYMPISLDHLVDAAQAGRLAYAYPEHSLRLNRFYWITPLVIVCSLMVLLMAWVIF